METTVLKNHKKLTEKFKKIFGKDIVEKAYISTYFYPDQEEKNEPTSRLNMLYNSTFGEDGEISFNANANDVVVKFKNGKMVIFIISEWMTIENLKNFIMNDKL